MSEQNIAGRFLVGDGLQQSGVIRNDDEQHLGEIAYNAYCASGPSDPELFPWDELASTSQRRWIFAAQAVGSSVAQRFGAGGVIEPHRGFAIVGEPGPEIVTIPSGAQVYPRTFDTRRHKRVRLIDDDGTEWAGVLYVVESDTDGRVPAVREH